MKTIPIIILMLCATMAFAEPQTASAPPKEKGIDRLGGFVLSPISKDAKYVVLTDNRAKPDASILTEFEKKVTVNARLAAKIVPASEEVLANTNKDLVICLVDAGDFTVYPEKKIALVPAGTKDIQKVLWEALAYLTVTTSKPTAQSVMAVAAGARANGVPMVHRVPYMLAVKQGWAPAPTNDVQKAVWDRVMAEKAASATNAPSATPPAK